MTELIELNDRKCQLCHKPFRVDRNDRIQVLHCKRCGYVADVAMIGEDFAWFKLSVTTRRAQALAATSVKNKLGSSELANRRTRLWMVQNNDDV